MNPNEIQDLVELLIEIGGSLAQAGYEIAYRYAIFQGISSAVWAFVLLIPGYVLLRFALYGWKKYKEDKYSMWDFNSILAGTLSAICFVSVPFSIQRALSHLIVPEWYAIQNLLSLIK